MASRAAQARQRPALLPALSALGLLLGACASVRAQPVTAAHPVHASDSRRAAACSAEGWPAPHWSDLTEQEVPAGAKVTRVEIRGNGGVPARLVREAIRVKAGDPLDPRVVAADLLRIWKLEAFSDVQAGVDADGGGVALFYSMQERRLISHVFIAGDGGIGVRAGDLYEPARLQRRVRDLVERAKDDGHLLARARVRARAVDARGVDLCVDVQRGPRFVIDRIVFDGNRRVDDATLLDVLHTFDGQVNTHDRPYRADLLEQDRMWLEALYFDRGMLSVRIDPPHVTIDQARHRLIVHVGVQEGPVFELRKVAFRGKLAASRATYQKLLGAKRGEVFDRSSFAAGIARIRAYHLWRGHRELDVVPETTLDAAQHAVDVVLRVETSK